MFKFGEREDIKNWRPAIHKVSDQLYGAGRKIKLILPNTISTDRKGFVKGRDIFQVDRLLQDIIDYADMEDPEGFIIVLGQQKAFDRVEWEWIDLCLQKFGFDEKFRGWVFILFKNCNQTNGFTSKYIGIFR